MALGGMEQMMVALLGKMGIDPEMVKGVAANVQETTQRVNTGLDAQATATQRIEAKLDRVEVMLERILEHVEPKPDGGYVLGTGHEDDVVLNGDGSPMTHEQAIHALTEG
jgi:hypothetical protein